MRLLAETVDGVRHVADVDRPARREVVTLCGREADPTRPRRQEFHRIEVDCVECAWLMR